MMRIMIDPIESASNGPSNHLTGRRWWLACVLVFAGSLAATVPTTGDFGLTWDEPAYRFSQQRSAEWWHRMANAKTSYEREALLESDSLLFFWTYGRFGINFHPPLAGQLNLLTHAVFGRWMKDIPSRRMASVIEYALTITIWFGFLARRYGTWVGLVAAGSLLVDASGLRRHAPGDDRPSRPPSLGRDGRGFLEGSE